MRIATATAVLAGATSASILAQQQQGQHVLSDTHETVKAAADSFSFGPALETLEDALKGATSEVKALWEDLKLLVPGAVNNISFFSNPKAHSRRPDSEWDYVVKGADVQKLWVQDTQGEHRKVGGRLDTYNLRAKKVDPSKLGVDSVKQYSGYLDDEASDKHLFYCESCPGRLLLIRR